MKPEDIVVSSIQAAEMAGFTIRRGAVFDSSRMNGNHPSVCNWLGAVLWMYHMMHLASPQGFAPEFMPEVLRALEVDRAWVWRVSHGFDYGNCLNFTYVEPSGKDGQTTADKVSRWANQLAKRFVKERP